MSVDPGALLADLQSELAPIFDAMDWAEDEIGRAQRQHPAAADTLWHSFKLLTLPDGMGTEFVYRGHAREMLERVAAGGDTRPGTAAEVCLAIVHAGKVTPISLVAFGLLQRMWAQAFPGHPIDAEQAALQPHYEAVRGPAITNLEADTRGRLAKPSRTLGAITCRGMHHGETVRCRYQPRVSTQLPLALPAVA